MEKEQIIHHEEKPITPEALEALHQILQETMERCRLEAMARTQLPRRYRPND